jgi:hypothetical protein
MYVVWKKYPEKRRGGVINEYHNRHFESIATGRTIRVATLIKSYRSPESPHPRQEYVATLGSIIEGEEGDTAAQAKFWMTAIQVLDCWCPLDDEGSEEYPWVRKRRAERERIEAALAKVVPMHSEKGWKAKLAEQRKREYEEDCRRAGIDPEEWATVKLERLFVPPLARERRTTSM